MRRETWRHFDFWLLGAVAILTIFGIATIRSAIAGNESLADLPSRQVIFAVIGFLVLLVVAAIDYHLWVPGGKVLFALVILLLIVLRFVGEALGGAARWLNLGLFFLQPSELAKIAMILILADFFSRNQDRRHDLRWIARSLAPTAVLAGLIFIQPDLSTAITLLVIWFALLWASGLHIKQLMVFAVAGLIGAIGSFPLLEDYQKGRIINFLFPNPNARYGDNYNVSQALVTIGSGGWFGQGYGEGSQVQLRFLKVRHTDFIFSTISEEFGFVGALLVLAVLAFILWRILRAARDSHDTFGALVCYGVAVFIFFHTTINVAMNLNLIPVTGLPLPFVSYGGSSLLTTLLGIGLVESVILRHKPLEF